MSTSIFGSVVLRTEDPRFIRGRGRYTDNVDAEGALDASFVRSMMPHARVVRVDCRRRPTCRGSPRSLPLPTSTSRPSPRRAA